MKNGDVSAIKNINRKITYKFLLDGEELPLSDIMDNPTITYDCGLEQYSVGNLYIGELSFSVKNTVFVNYKSKIEIEIQQIDSYTYYTNYIGEFYVATVEEQGLTKKIKAYDKLFTLNVGYFPSAKHTSTKPLMEDIANQYRLVFTYSDLSLIRTWTYGDIPINNEQLEGKTVLEMLSLVAGVHGGSFFVDGWGILKLTQPTLATSNVTFTQSEYSVPTLDDTTTYNITKLRVTYGEQTTNDDGSIKDTGYYEVGSGTDTHTLAISNPLLKGQQAQAQAILNQIKAMNGYKRFDTTILLGDYRLEPMDVITYVKNDVSYVVPIIYMQYVLTHKGLTVKTQSPTIAESKKEFSFKGTITQKIDNVYTEVMQVKDIVANTITVNELEAINAKIENLQATDATITNLVAGKADIEDLNATNATIENLKATDAEITNLVANKADIKDLNATNATIDNLQADVADINTLLAGNITSGNIQSGSITSDKLVIDDGFIKDAMIDTISANKILAGRLDTGAITIGSEDGKMLIADETIQISDGTNVRVQIGETANGDYALVIWDENGEVMFDATGITEHAIKDAIIKDDMVSDNANINAQKIDIASLFTVINEDGSHTLNGSKIFLDTQQQTLNVAFNSMTTKQDELEEKTDTLTTELTVQSGQIETLIKNTTITDNGQEILLKDKVSSITQDIDSITTKVETVESNVTDLSQRVASAELKITDDAIVSTVTNSQVFKDAIDTLETGNDNLLKHTRTFKEVIESDDWSTDIETTSGWTTQDYYGNEYKELYFNKTLYDTNSYVIGIPLYPKCGELKDKVLTVSFDYTNSAYLYFSIGRYAKNAKTTLDNEYTQTVNKISIYNNSDAIYDELENYRYAHGGQSSTKWTRITYTFNELTDDVLDNYEYRLVFHHDGKYASSTHIRKPMVNYGSNKVEWASSPKDLDGNLDDLYGRVYISETKIEQNADAITLRATKEEVNTQVNEVNEKVTENTTRIGELEVSTNNISLSLSEKASKEELTQGLTNVESGLDGKITTNSEKISQIEMDLDSIELTVSNTNQVIQETSIGIRNWIRNSAFLKGTEFWTTNRIDLISVDGAKVFNAHPSMRMPSEPTESGGVYLEQSFIPLGESENGVVFKGDKITISCWYYCEDVSSFALQGDKFLRLALTGRTFDGDYPMVAKEIFVYVDEESRDNWTDGSEITIPLVERKWTKIEASFVIDDDTFKNLDIAFGENGEAFTSFEIQFSVHGGGVVWATDFMTTKGNKAPNEWISAPEDTDEEIKNINDKVIINTENIASLQINADSINASVQRVETTMNNSLNNINNNIETLTNRVDATMSAEDVKIAISQEVANGTSKVTTETGFVFDKDGLTISKSDSEMSTVVDEDGMTIYKNNDVMLDVNNQGVNAQNINVSTYLIVGNNSRFENYGSLRTGCFFIGQTTATTSEEEE